MRTPLGLAVGEDGVGVSDITSAYDAEGNTAVTVALTDGSTRSFTVQKGEGATYETATQSADGLMSAADKAKLDNIEAGAEANAIDGVQVNGTALSIAQKIVNLLIVSGASDGAISVNGVDVAVTGLAALAYKAEVAYADLAAALKAVIDGHTADLSTLIGSDTGKSVRTIANEELAAQLIPANAQEALDTLQEISAWIQSHPGEVADINRKLTLGTNNGVEYATVKAYVEAMVSGLITLSALSANVTGAGNAITGVAYDNTSGVLSFTKGQTFLTEHQDISGKVDKVSGKGLSTNDYTDADKAKVAAALTQHQDISGKVDKVSGKGLSTNDYTDAEKTKLSGIAAQANKTIIDTTLSNAGQAADAKATGDAIAFLREYLKSMDIYRTASGNPATFSDADAANMKNLRVTLTPTQSGSGDPSPTNIRPISGVSSVSVTRTGQNGANSQTVTVQLTDGSNPLTVYGGTLDVTAGELTVTHKSVTFNGTENWDGPYGTLPVWQLVMSDKKPGYGLSLCSTMRNNGLIRVWMRGDNAPDFSFTDHNELSRVYFRASDQFTTTSDWTAWLADNPSQFVYQLATPLTYQLTPQQLATLSGYNAVSANAGNVSVTYKADTALALQTGGAA